MGAALDDGDLGGNWPAVPYPGVRPFQITERSDESLVFFGRDGHSLQVLDRLYESPFLAITGPSGCGKSSLIKAGVIPKLNAGLIMRAGPRWITTTMEPGRDPVAALQRAWDRAVEAGRASDTEIPRLGDDAFEKRVDALAILDEQLARANGGGTNVLLLVDQFEELFRRDLSTPERAAHFVNLLLNAYHAPSGRLYVILTLRSDALEECAQFKGLHDVLNHAQYFVPGLNEDEFEEAIVRPATLPQYRGAVEPELVSKLLGQVTGGAIYDPDGLPLLQHALQLMWRRTERRTEGGGPLLDLPLYESLQDVNSPGLAGLLSKHANDLLNSVPRRSAEALFQLTSRQGEFGKPTRRSTSIDEVVAVGSVDPSDVARVLEVFGGDEASFIRLSEDTGRIELTHESLIRQWDALTRWTREEDEKRREFEILVGRAQKWKPKDGGRPDGLLTLVKRSGIWWLKALKRQRKRGDLLGTGDLRRYQRWWSQNTPTAAWAARYGYDFDLVSRFMDASERRRRRNLVLGTAASVAAAGFGLLVSLLGVEVLQGRTAVRVGEISRLANDSIRYSTDYPQRGALLAVEAVRHARANGLDVPLDAQAALREALSKKLSVPLDGGPAPLPAWTFAKPLQSGSIATRSGAQTLTSGFTFDRWPEPQPGDQRRLMFGHNLSNLPHDRCRDQIAIGGRDGVMRVWNTDTAAFDSKPSRAIDAGSRITGVRFLPGCENLAVATRDGKVAAWHVPDDKLQAIGGSGAPTTSLNVTADGAWLIAAGEAPGLLVWRLADLEAEPRRLPSPAGPVIDVAVAPQGAIVAAAARGERDVFVWNLTTGTVAHPIPLEGHDSNVVSLIFTPNGERLISAGEGGDLLLWRVGSWAEPVHRLKPNREDPRIYKLSVSPDSRWLLASGDTFFVDFWDLEAADPAASVKSPRFHGGRVTAAEFDPQGELLVTGSFQEIVVWRLNPGEIVKVADSRLPKSWITSIAFSPNGNRLAAGSLGGVRVFRRTQKNLLRLPDWRGHDTFLSLMAFSNDGRTLFTGAQDGTARAWQTTEDADEQRFEPQEFRNGSADFAVSGDGTMLAAPEERGTKLLFWRLSDPKSAASPLELTATKLSYRGSKVLTAAYFAPDDRWLMVGNAEGEFRAWETADLAAGSEPIVLPLTDAPGSLRAIAFTGDGKHLVARTAAGSKVWTVRADDNTFELLNEREFPGSRVYTRPDGGLMVADSNQATLVSADANADPAASVTLNPPSAFSGLTVQSIGKKHLAVGNVSGGLYVWNLERPGSLARRIDAHDTEITALTMNPSETMLASGDSSGRVIVHDLSSPSGPVMRTELRSHDTGVGVIEFSPDGRWLATAGADETVRVWPLPLDSKLVPLRIPWRGSEPSQMQFLKNPERLLIGSSFALRAFLLDLDELVEAGCHVAGRNLTRREWNQFVGERAYERTCPQYPGQ
ncbi:hypothetical protein [Thalassobaculum sp.]|uniref:WD40 repeat domain-containing protein n=1 Tax=Thalassobaculum sp. TaxID=2022740 RepID=UPI0032EDB1DA